MQQKREHKEQRTKQIKWLDYQHKNQIKMTLEHLIEKAIIDVKYYQDRLREAELKLDAFYIARDTKADNPYNK
jgi:hypothetical protein